MHQSLDDIADLAEEIGNRFIFRGKVNLEKIAKGEHICFIESNYGNYFIGQLVHYLKRFYILLNTDLLTQCEFGRVRFTIAHELGHYFVDAHRTQLAKGVSLSFQGELSEAEYKYIEIAANHFAANLLMPKNHFIKQARKLETGLAGILILKAKYCASVECTIKHYVNLNLSASLLIRWKADHTFHYSWCSETFAEITFIKKHQIPIRFDTEYIRKQVEIIDTTGSEYIESATFLSRWISTIMQGTTKDILGIEQTIRLGDFGGITLLTFQL